jgi:hypothetical protein
VNADIILMPDFVSTALQMKKLQDKFLLVGQRYDLDIREELDFKGNWKEEIENLLRDGGKLHSPDGSDYFIYTRKVYTDVPEFTIGRAGWDNWFIYHAVTQPWMAVDATRSIKVIHQNHDYSHLPDSKPHYTLPESIENIRLAGGRKNMYALYDINLSIEDGYISRIKMDLLRFIRLLERNIHPAGMEPKGFRWRITLSLIKLKQKLLARK